MNNKEKFIKYENLLKQWSQKMNLVAPSTLSDVQKRHIEDSAQLAEFLPKNANVIDLGSGAGFPGVVLAIMGWNVTCIESIRKKTDFLSALKKELELNNLNIINNRIEKVFEKKPANIGNFVFTARAFAPLVKILDYTHRLNYHLFLLKGREVSGEIELAKKRYDFDYELFPSKTGDGFIITIKNIKKK